MRGTDTQQSGMFSYLSPEERVPERHPLRAIRRMTDEVLQGLSAKFNELYSASGRPSIAPEKLLRALLLQILYTVRSDFQLPTNPGEFGSDCEERAIECREDATTRAGGVVSGYSGGRGVFFRRSRGGISVRGLWGRSV